MEVLVEGRPRDERKGFLYVFQGLYVGSTQPPDLPDLYLHIYIYEIMNSYPPRQ